MAESGDYDSADLFRSSRELMETLGTYLDEHRQSLPQEKLQVHERQISACDEICKAIEGNAPQEVIEKLIDDLTAIGDLPEGIALGDIEDCRVV